ncbi:aspartate aminotransferase [Aspergillus steynii IBT 23096]|uniref:Aspartate aminotransferase n=1 Tax=Aspergillus steynii IBT 23096 TaxID=1392250 RepID=A0A2I2FXR2_9EURO|nr:aspartate aminotransferase [Aspergillus steynii IBT 23096]PLB45413.1 aspartate aminotransferase [Aspergillus steynii IBT 23096]
MFFDAVEAGAPDVMYGLKIAADGDQSPLKVDLGVGIYRNELGAYNEMSVLRKAKDELYALNPDHDYEVTTGNPRYLANAAKVAFGGDSPVLDESRIASVQTISGTGSIHLALMFLARSPEGKNRQVYIGTPAWGNYVPMCNLAGLETKTYTHYNPATGGVDFPSVLDAVRTADVGSVFILQGCCHNPTAADFSREQWRTLAVEMKNHHLLPLFDIAYQGLGDGLDEDSYSVRYFAQMGFEMIVCQSFSKSLGLYGERVGVCHVVCASRSHVYPVHDQLRCLIRWEFSSSPAYGSRLVDLVLSDPLKEAEWNSELSLIRSRLRSIREALFRQLNDVLKVPGNWGIILQGKGLFCLLPLSPEQCKDLREKHHIYIVPNGRITLSGLSDRNIEYVGRCISQVVEDSP